MLSQNEAYQKLRKKAGLIRVGACLDFGNFYVFSLIPYDSSEANYTGVVFPAVDKSNGRIFDYDITSDIEAYENATPVEVNTIYDQKI